MSLCCCSSSTIEIKARYTLMMGKQAHIYYTRMLICAHKKTCIVRIESCALTMHARGWKWRAIYAVLILAGCMHAHATTQCSEKRRCVVVLD